MFLFTEIAFDNYSAESIHTQFLVFKAVFLKMALFYIDFWFFSGKCNYLSFPRAALKMTALFLQIVCVCVCVHTLIVIKI